MPFGDTLDDADTLPLQDIYKAATEKDISLRRLYSFINTNTNLGFKKACSTGDTDMVQFFLDRGATNTNAGFLLGLHHGHMHIIKYLIANVAELPYAAELMHDMDPDLFTLLLEKQCTINKDVFQTVIEHHIRSSILTTAQYYEIDDLEGVDICYNDTLELMLIHSKSNDALYNAAHIGGYTNTYWWDVIYDILSNHTDITPEFERHINQLMRVHKVNKLLAYNINTFISTSKSNFIVMDKPKKKLPGCVII